MAGTMRRRFEPVSWRSSKMRLPKSHTTYWPKSLKCRVTITGAKEYLKKMLYVAPTSVVAHLDLAALYAKEQDQARACHMYMRVIELLQGLPPNAIIEPFVDLPASELLPEVRRQLEQLGFHHTHLFETSGRLASPQSRTRYVTYQDVYDH